MPIKAAEGEVIDMRALIAISIVIAILLLILFLPVFIAAFNLTISIKKALAIAKYNTNERRT